MTTHTELVTAAQSMLAFEEWWKAWGPQGIASARQEVARAAWHEGFKAGREEGLRAAWDAIDALIRYGELPYPAHEQRNGIVLACNAVAKLRGWPEAKYAEEVTSPSTRNA